jgi:hypothetical protein
LSLSNDIFRLYSDFPHFTGGEACHEARVL